jgi:hypothetical protein
MAICAESRRFHKPQRRIAMNILTLFDENGNLPATMYSPVRANRLMVRFRPPSGQRASGLVKCTKTLPGVVCLLAAAACSLSANSLSFTGTLDSPESVFEDTFILTAADTVTFQTWGFGGGTNAAGLPIPSGGFDPLIALFNGPPAVAAMFVDGSGNPLVDADNLFNPPWSFVGNCPPAGTVAIGTNRDCGDDSMKLVLSAGTYTVLLSDANYVPNSVYDNGLLSEGFTDLTGGVFQTCDTDGSCITPNGNYAVDIVSAHSDLTNAPEPLALSLLGAGLAALAGLKQLRKRALVAEYKKGAAQ